MHANKLRSCYLAKLYPSLNFNGNSVYQVQLQKHLDLDQKHLGSKLGFDEHIQRILIN